MDLTRPDAYDILWRAYHLKGDYSQAYAAFIKFHTSKVRKDVELRDYVKSYLQNSWFGVLLRQFETFKGTKPDGSQAYKIAVLSSHVGWRKETLADLNKALDKKMVKISYTIDNSGFDFLIDDPRFNKLIRRVSRSQ